MKFAQIMAVAIFSVWVIVVLYGLLRNDYRGITVVTPLMLTVAGFLFGVRRNGKGG